MVIVYAFIVFLLHKWELLKNNLLSCVTRLNENSTQWDLHIAQQIYTEDVRFGICVIEIKYESE